jgi:N-acetylglutamate synthase-like GNAT family acetyltransferase
MIREANTNDIESMVSIMLPAYKDAFKGIIDNNILENKTTEIQIGKLNKTFYEWLYFVFEENEVIKGVVSGKIHDNNSCEIIQLYVGIEYQGKNIGKKLLEYMKLYFKNKNCNKMIIWTLKNARNNTFYRNNGGIIFEEKDLEIGNKKYPGIGFEYDLK